MRHAYGFGALDRIAERGGWLAVAAFAAVASLAGVWTLPPLDRDEARFAQASAQMLESGDFVSIRFQDAERNKKPAGVHWLQAASVSAFSDVRAREIWAYRLPSALGGVLAAVFTYFAAAALYDRRTGLLAGVLLAAAPLAATESTIAKTDATLLALVCLAQLAFIRALARGPGKAGPGWLWPAVFWTAQGAAALVKGPIAPMISGLTGLGLAAARPRMGLAALRPRAGIAWAGLIVAPWAIAIGIATEGRFFAEAVGEDMLAKLGVPQERHGAPPGYHAGMALLLFWPAAALILPGLLESWRDRERWRTRFVFAWLVPAWAVFELTATKLPHYTLPLYPALAIIAARAATAPPQRRSLPLQKAGAVAYCLVGLGAAALIVVLPAIYGFWPAHGALYALGAAATAIAALGAGALFWRGAREPAALAAAILASVYAWLLMGAILPGLERLSVSPQISRTLEAAGLHPLRPRRPEAEGGAAPAALVGYHEPSAVFLLGGRTRHLDAAAAARQLLAGEISAAIVDARAAAAFEAGLADARGGADRAARALAVIEGINYSNGRPVSLTIYIPGEAGHKPSVP